MKINGLTWEDIRIFKELLIKANEEQLRKINDESMTELAKRLVQKDKKEQLIKKLSKNLK